MITTQVNQVSRNRAALTLLISLLSSAFLIASMAGNTPAVEARNVSSGAGAAVIAPTPTPTPTVRPVITVIPITPMPIPSPIPTWPALREGDSGQRVETLQRLLIHHRRGDTVDGYFGPSTTQGVLSFQQLHHLTADGVVRPSTWQALTVTLRGGSYGWAVRALQDELIYRGYPISNSGNFGPETDAAVRAYQQSRGLIVDGIVGTQTWRAVIQGR